ncbi:MAG: DUF1310 family protein [Abiotrophia defectiva]|uniref:DUF1310 family protein n=1 Tax=Abiotrophia defectiva TaxID=46125 RepID=A0A929MN08_ABIDE|nr:DUF1310 family protein [Abiotrophia defectiva]
MAYQGVNWMVQNNKKEQYAELVSFFDSQEVRAEIEQVIKSEDPHAFTEAGVIKKYELDYDSMGVRTGRSIRVLINDDSSVYIGVKYIFVNNKWQMSIVTVSNKLHVLLKSKE